MLGERNANFAEMLLALRRYKALVKPTTWGLMLLGCEIPPEVKIGKRFEIPHNGNGVIIHETTVIGDGVRIYQGVSVGRQDTHVPVDLLPVSPRGGIIIHDGVLLGAGAKVFFRSGQTVELGEGCVIAANAVLTQSVPAGEIWGGIPAKKLGENSHAGRR